MNVNSIYPVQKHSPPFYLLMGSEEEQEEEWKSERGRPKGTRGSGKENDRKRIMRDCAEG